MPAGEVVRRGVVRGHGQVLLVDDEPLLRRSVRRVLEHMGYAVIEAADGAAGVEAFRAHRRSLVAVVLDHVMPVMSGSDAFRVMHELDPTVPVIMTSGRMEESTEEELRGLGLTAVVPKPFDVQQLSQVLRAATHPATAPTPR